MIMSAMQYLDMNDMNMLINRLDERDEQHITIINAGQLESCMESPKTTLFGQEQYVSLHEKIAILMEKLIKSHCLSDGNKRLAVLAASYMAELNGMQLTITVDAINLIRNAAMDSDDTIRENIQFWIKSNLK